ncbi:SAV_2336 N-terminal domain-related protein, partial [Streptomyces sp. NPDC060235]|uniref:SAV_2336 N-terminal domain-related protein n=1 Tax=Streptomyces sp. NPDC060235 TaxID=3347080 RepID=UPI00366189B3
MVETLWLAARITESSVPDERSSPRPKPDDEQSSSNTDRSATRLETDTVPEPSPSPWPTAESAVPLHVPSTGAPSGTRSALGMGVRIPAAPALSHELDLLRALRPLKRRVPSTHQEVIDEAATAERVAEQRVFLPATRPARERWLRLSLVVEATASMVLWETLTAELQIMLRRSGAFKGIRLWHLHSDTRGAVGLHPRADQPGAPHNPRELIDPTGRHAIWVISDCVSDLWHTGKADQLLDLWGHAGPLAVIQPLPQRLWNRSGLRPVATRLESVAPGAANSQLRIVPSGLAALGPAAAGTHGTMPPGLPVPVLELNPSWLARWARLTAGQAQGGVPGIVTMAAPPTVGDACTAVTGPEAQRLDGPRPVNRAGAQGDATTLVRAFRTAASPQAFRLAGYLAAAPLTLPVMRLVQQVMLPGSDPAHLAEVFVSGLLVRDREDPREARYDFVAGVRDVLLGTVRVSDIDRVYAEVSAYVTSRMGQPRDAAAVVSPGAGVGDVPVDMAERPFGEVPAWVLRRHHPLVERDEGRTEQVPSHPERLPDAVSQETPESKSVPTRQALARDLGVVLVGEVGSGSATWEPLKVRILEDESLRFVRVLQFSSSTRQLRLNPLQVFSTLDTVADSLREYLDTEVGSYEDLVLVAHSTGGLLVQRFLVRMLAEGRGRELARIRRVVLLACPSRGSELLLTNRRIFSRHPQERELRVLENEAAATQRVVLRDVVHAEAVSERTCPISFSIYAGESDTVVPASSARSIFPTAGVLPGDHATILKTTTPEHRTFTTLRRLFLKSVHDPSQPSRHAGTSQNQPPEAFTVLPLPEDPGETTHGDSRSSEFLNVVPDALSGLPIGSTPFTGREAELAALLTHLAPAADSAGTQQPVQMVVGMAGVGKTELAIQASKEAAQHWFPGGILFADLHGYGTTYRTTSSNVLDGFLRTLGVPPEGLPPDDATRSRLLRSILHTRAQHGRRTLLVLDNASSEEQVRPLLPHDGVTAVLITSRSIFDIGARLHSVDVLSPDASVELLRKQLQLSRGHADSRVNEDPTAAEQIVALCGYLPLALKIAASLLADFPARPLSSLAEALKDESHRLAVLSRGGIAVSSAFDISYNELAPDQARMYRLLSLNPGPELSTEAAAILVDANRVATERTLQALARAHLIDASDRWGRWRLQSLLRLHAEDIGRKHVDSDRRDFALARLLDFYLSTAQGAAIHLSSYRSPPSSPFTDRARALEWLDTERTNLMSAALHAPKTHAIHTEMAYALAHYLKFRRLLEAWLELATHALDTCKTLGDRLGEGKALTNFGNALQELRRFEEALDAHTAATTAFRELGDRHGEANALTNLG